MGKITEIHGWIRLRHTYENSDDADEREEELLPEAIVDVRAKIRELTFQSAEVRVVESCGSAFVTLCGMRWNSGDWLSAEELFEYVSCRAKGSYGMLHGFFHDEGEVRVRVLKRGRVIDAEDSHFSPMIPAVTDPYESSCEIILASERHLPFLSAIETAAATLFPPGSLPPGIENDSY